MCPFLIGKWQTHTFLNLGAFISPSSKNAFSKKQEFKNLRWDTLRIKIKGNMTSWHKIKKKGETLKCGLDMEKDLRELMVISNLLLSVNKELERI